MRRLSAKEKKKNSRCSALWSGKSNKRLARRLKPGGIEFYQAGAWRRPVFPFPIWGLPAKEARSQSTGHESAGNVSSPSPVATGRRWTPATSGQDREALTVSPLYGVSYRPRRRRLAHIVRPPPSERHCMAYGAPSSYASQYGSRLPTFFSWDESHTER